ncbi:MAG: hypothetical protein OXT69_14085 [Candidatus Poribacteria bacterium]|nr:hypothetical protein [Candidatus Poribacteria bacterium]
MSRRASATAVLLALTAAPLLQNAAQTNLDSISTQLQAGVNDLMTASQTIHRELPESELAKQIADILSNTATALTEYDEQLLARNISREESIDMLRKRYREQMEPLHDLKPINGAKVRYDEAHQNMRIYESGSVSRASSKGDLLASGSVSLFEIGLGSNLERLFDLHSFVEQELRTDPNAFTRALKYALDDFKEAYRNIYKDKTDREFAQRFNERISEISADMIKLDGELRRQNASYDKRVSKLRGRFQKWMKRFNDFKPVENYEVEYDAGDFTLLFIHTPDPGSYERGGGRISAEILGVLDIWNHRNKTRRLRIAIAAAFAVCGLAFLYFRKRERRPKTAG